MITIYLREEISCAHRLKLPYRSKCKKMHGHNYLIEVWIRGEKNKYGMIVDFSKVKDTIKKLDHRVLNRYIEQPTAENLAEYLASKIKGLGNNIKEVKVRVWEDKDSYAEILF